MDISWSLQAILGSTGDRVEYIAPCDNSSECDINSDDAAQSRTDAESTQQLIQPSKIKDELGVILDKLSLSGSFVSCHRMMPLNPGLKLELGDVLFPISDVGVREIQLASLCDTTSRSSSRNPKFWKVSAKSVRIRNPLWKKLIKCFLDIAASEMGTDSKTQGLGVEEPELILYGPGSTQEQW